MKIGKLSLFILGATLFACSAPVDSESDESTGAEALSNGTHFNFAASPLAGPGGPSFFTQMRPIGSEVPDIMCPGPTYTPTWRIYDAKGTLFTGSGGSCDGSYAKATNGQIIVKCSTPIEKRTCPAKSPATT